MVDIPDEQIEGIWRQILDIFWGGILADWCTNFFLFCLCHSRGSGIADTLLGPLDVQEAEENFDLALIASIETDVVTIIYLTPLSLSLEKSYTEEVKCAVRVVWMSMVLLWEYMHKLGLTHSPWNNPSWILEELRHAVRSSSPLAQVYQLWKRNSVCALSFAVAHWNCLDCTCT